MVLQVHDELVLRVPDSEVMEAAALVRSVMEGAYHFGRGAESGRRVGRTGTRWRRCGTMGGKDIREHYPQQWLLVEGYQSSLAGKQASSGAVGVSDAIQCRRG